MSVILVCGGLLSFLLGFVWLIFLKCFAGCMIWTTIVLIVLLSLTIAILGYAKAGILTASQFDSAVSVPPTPTPVHARAARLPGAWSLAADADHVRLALVHRWIRSTRVLAPA